MADRATRWKLAWQQSPLAACPQEMHSSENNALPSRRKPSYNVLAPLARDLAGWNYLETEVSCRAMCLCNIAIFCLMMGCAVLPLPGEAQTTALTHETFPRKIDGRVVLAETAADGSLVFEVAIGTCVGDECPVLVSLLRGNTIIDQKQIEWSSRTSEATQEELEPGWGAGDPIHPAHILGWSTGEEEGYLGMAIRPVNLAPDVRGLLIDLRSGFEHLKRRHELYVALNRKLKRVWEASEGAGPTWSGTAVVSLGVGKEGILLFSGFLSPIKNEPDQLEISLLQWDSASALLRQRPARGNVKAVVVSGYVSVAAAQQARDEQADCLGRFWVLPATRFPGVSTGRYVLTLPGSTEWPQDFFDRTRACIRDGRVSMERIR